MLKHLLILILLLPLVCRAQGNLSGRIIDAASKKPIANATVFLSNSTVNSISHEDGSFVLTNVKSGQYELVISAAGYETIHKSTYVGGDLTLPVIELKSQARVLNTVIVKPNAERLRMVKLFTEEFLGDVPEAAQCRIINPQVLKLRFDKTKQILTASSDDYLEVENKALGYNIKYQLTSFICDYETGQLHYYGNVIFNNMAGTLSQLRDWKIARLNAYLGSGMHYFRSLLSGPVANEGFTTKQLVRKTNTTRKADSVIKAKIKYYKNMHRRSGMGQSQNTDSLTYWTEQLNLPKTIDSLNNNFLRVDNLIKDTDVAGIYSISYTNSLYVEYKRASTENINLTTPRRLVNIISFTEPLTYFDNNGSVINPNSLFYQGTWEQNRLARLLPVDYEPNETETVR